MRIFVKIQPESGSEGKFPADYRRIFMSLLKQVYKRTPFEEIVNSHDRIPKPYVFSVGFNKIKDISGDSIIFESPIFFNFSSSIPQMVGYLYNYIVSQDSIMNGLKVAGVDLPVPKIITSKTVTFKIMGSAVLTRAEKDRYYVLPEDNDFEEALNHSIQVRLNLSRELFETFGVRIPNFKPVKVVNKNLRKVPAKHYGGYIEAFSGTITLDGDPDVLSFLHENGLGVRTGQGVGMLKVVREWH